MFKNEPFFSGNYFASHFIMGGEKFDSTHPEGYLFGENTDLNFLGTRPVAVRNLTSWEFSFASVSVNENHSCLDRQTLSEGNCADLVTNMLTCRDYFGSINSSCGTFQPG